MNVRVLSQPSALRAARTRIGDFAGLMKVRLNLLVLGAVATGYALGCAPGELSLGTLLPLLVGVLLSGGGSSAWNMAIESDRDALMIRTRNRPIPQGRVTRPEALAFGMVLSGLGVTLVGLAGGWVAAACCAGTVALYVFAYTPLKPRTPWNTWVGAVPGALPPLIGWAAATGTLNTASLTLFGIVFFWQFPHFMAIASIHREDYTRGGFAMLPSVDPSGMRAARVAILTAMALIPMTLLPAVFRLTGPLYFTGAFVISLLYAVFSVRAALSNTLSGWRDLLRTSLVILPGLFVLMLVDRLHL